MITNQYFLGTGALYSAYRKYLDPFGGFHIFVNILYEAKMCKHVSTLGRVSSLLSGL